MVESGKWRPILTLAAKPEEPVKKRQTVSAFDDAHERRRIAELASVPGAFDPRRAAILGWQRRKAREAFEEAVRRDNDRLRDRRT
jgi:hypothetical protein